MSAVFAVFAGLSFAASLGIALEAAHALDARTAVTWRFLSSLTFGLFFLIAGSAHFDKALTERLYIPMMPPFIPHSLRHSVNNAAGVVEVGVGIATLAALAMGSKSGAMLAAKAALAVLGVVFPANVYVAVSTHAQLATGQSQSFAVIRLFIQVTFCAWAAWPLLSAVAVRSG